MRKLYSILLNLCLMLNLPVNTHATDTNKKLNYIALGDSIALGFQPNGIELKDGCYADLLKKYFEENFSKVNHQNYGIVGQNSKNLLDQINKIELKKADLITISIGSNDILMPFTSILHKSLNCKNRDEFNSKLNQLIVSAKNYNLLSMKKIYSAINNLLNSQDIFDNAVCDFEKNFTEIIINIKKKNPKAQIFVTNFYNPFSFISSFGFKDFEKFSNDIMNKMNNNLEKLSCNYNFKTVDINYIGNDISNLNVNLDSENFLVDPHPNQLGHTKIYEKIIETMSKKIEKN